MQQRLVVLQLATQAGTQLHRVGAASCAHTRAPLQLGYCPHTMQDQCCPQQNGAGVLYAMLAMVATDQATNTLCLHLN